MKINENKLKNMILAEVTAVIQEGEFRHGGTRVNPFTTPNYKEFKTGIPPSEMDKEQDQLRAMEAVNYILEILSIFLFRI